MSLLIYTQYMNSPEKFALRSLTYVTKPTCLLLKFYHLSSHRLFYLPWSSEELCSSLVSGFGILTVFLKYSIILKLHTPPSFLSYLWTEFKLETCYHSLNFHILHAIEEQVYVSFYLYTVSMF